jgi:hypothetical protein
VGWSLLFEAFAAKSRATSLDLPENLRNVPFLLWGIATDSPGGEVRHLVTGSTVELVYFWSLRWGPRRRVVEEVLGSNVVTVLSEKEEFDQVPQMSGKRFEQCRILHASNFVSRKGICGSPKHTEFVH